MNLGVAWCASLRFKAPSCTLQTRWLGIENIHCLANRRPSQLWWECHLRRTISSQICILADSVSASCCFNRHWGTEGPTGVCARPENESGVLRLEMGFWPLVFSADVIMWLIWRQPGVRGLCYPGLCYPGQWKAETLRTFHLKKMNLMRAMENGKPGLGKGNVLFHVKQTNKKCDCGKHPKK